MVLVGSLNLTKGTDYEYSYADNTNVGTAKVTVTFKGDYASQFGSVEKTFEIYAKTLSSSNVADIVAQSYIGSALTPIVKCDGITLVKGTDYDIALPEGGCVNAGDYTVTITGKGNYSGTVEKTFAINPKTLVATNVAEIPDQFYSGLAIEPEVVVTDGEKTLTQGTDYEVTYSDNTNAGTAAKVTITGKGNYTGTVEKTFTINPRCVLETGALIINEDQDGRTAVIDGNYADEALLVIDEAYEVKSVTFDRTFTPGATSTIILPFAVNSGDYEGGTFYEFTSVDYENDKWVASLTKVAGNIEAHKPYLYMPSDDKLTIKVGVTLKATSAEEYADTKGDWTFKGVFKKKDWETGVRTDYFFASASATSTEGNAVNAGDFVRIGNRCHLSPLRCYLSYSASGSEQSLLKSAKELPSSIEVRLIDEVASVVEPDDNPSESGEVITPVSEITPNSGIKVWSFDGTIFIEAQPNMDYTIVDLSGRTLKTGVTNSTREEVSLSRAAGIVIVKIGNKTFKVQ